MDAPLIGICEDDAELRSVLTRALSREGFAVAAVSNGHDAVARFIDPPPSVVVLDIGLPDADGRDVCQALRAHGMVAPVIFLTVHESLADRLSGFHAGGDDYLSKPFELAELIVRLRALVRRADVAAPAPEMAGITLDPAGHAVRNGERAATLTPTEFRLLACLAARPQVVVRRHELAAVAWPDGAIVHDNTLDTYVARLRRKLREIDALEQIETRRGVGYVLH